jgi:hypothetical protein
MTGSARRLTLATVAGLLVGAVGIGIMWAFGVTFTFAIPPGIVILLIGAAVVGLVRRRWAPGVGSFLGMFVTVGFLISPTGFSNLLGDAGLGVAIGQAVMLVGVLVALVAGAAALRANYSSASVAPGNEAAR